MYEFLLTFHSNYGWLFLRHSDLWAKVAIFIPDLNLTPCEEEWRHQNFATPLIVRKTETLEPGGNAFNLLTACRNLTHKIRQYQYCAPHGFACGCAIKICSVQTFGSGFLRWWSDSSIAMCSSEASLWQFSSTRWAWASNITIRSSIVLTVWYSWLMPIGYLKLLILFASHPVKTYQISLCKILEIKWYV